MQWQDVTEALTTLEKTQGGFTLAHRGIVTMPDGTRVFVKIGVDNSTKKWIQRELEAYKLLETYSYPYMPRLLAQNDDHTALALELLASNEGWDWTDTWDNHRLDRTLEAMDTLASIAVTGADEEFRARRMLGANNDGWKPLMESEAKQKTLLAKLRRAGHDELANTLDIPGMAKQSTEYIFRDDTIVHYDVRADNCAWHSKLNTVKLIDWNWAQLGDRRIDISQTLVDVYRAGFDIMVNYANRLDPTALQFLAGLRLNAAASPIVPGMAEQASLRDYQLESGVTALALRDKLIRSA